MLGLFEKATPFLKKKPKYIKPRPDNFVFRLHYQFTFGILAVGCLLVTSYGYIDSNGSQIQCMMNTGVKVSGGIINKYCWIMSTFTLPKYWEGEPQKDGAFIHHGVGVDHDEDEKVYHAYYQWVPLMLSLQAVCFYFPHYLWKALEGGRLRTVIAGLNQAMVEDGEKKIASLSEYLIARRDYKWDHYTWAGSFFFCEILNLVNVIIQIFLTDRFLGGAFMEYGIEAASFQNEDPEARVDPMSKVFPRMTKCTFRKYGASGTIEKLDAMCVLGMNIINEKVYVFLWFWFVVLAAVTAINIVVRGFQLAFPSVRDRLLTLEEYGIRPPGESDRAFRRVIEPLSYPDWLILYYLAQSMDKGNFRKLMEKLDTDYSREDRFNNDSPDSTLKSPASLKNF